MTSEEILKIVKVIFGVILVAGLTVGISVFKQQIDIADKSEETVCYVVTEEHKEFYTIEECN